MISYAQNGEDAVLNRLFGTQATGRYVDIGAANPVHDSVTKHFYDLGWQGINVEPVPALFSTLAAARPRDLNLQVTVGKEAGHAHFWVAPQTHWGWSTTNPAVVEELRSQGVEFEEIEVQTITLASLLEQNPGPVDFLKIDVEGGERDVVEGADWNRFKPRVLVIEVLSPTSGTKEADAWEQILLDAGYRVALFDGLNRFYAQHDDDEALAALAAPVNVLDESEPYRWVSRVAEIEDAVTDLSGTITDLRETLFDTTVAQWWTTDALYESILPTRLISCPICGRTSTRDGYRVHPSACRFGGGSLERYACPDCDFVFGPVKMLDLTESKLGADSRARRAIFGDVDTAPVDDELRAFRSTQPRQEGTYLRWGPGAHSEAIDRLRAEGWEVHNGRPSPSPSSAPADASEAEEPAAFDGIFSANVVERFRNPVAEFRLMASWLRADGVMVHASPCYELAEEDDRFHTAFYVGRSIDELAARAGLEVIDRDITPGQYSSVTFRRLQRDPHHWWKMARPSSSGHGDTPR